MKIENKNNLAPWGISAKEAGEYAKKLSLAVRKALEELAKKEFRRNAELQVLQEREEKKMKISDQLKIIDEKTVKAIRDKWHEGEIVHAWNDDNKACLYILLVKDESDSLKAQEINKEGIVLKQTLENGQSVKESIGTNTILGIIDYYFPNFTDLIEELMTSFDHIEKCKNPKWVVNDDN